MATSARMNKFIFLLQVIFFAVKGLEWDKHEIDLTNSFVDKQQLSTMRQLMSSDHRILNVDLKVTDGAFGYEEYEWPCTSDMTAAYGYVLGQCSRGLTGDSYIYNWCALSEDESIVYFHVTEYPGSNCTQSETYNKTFWDYNTCDTVNSRKLFCTSSQQGWTNYDFDQHIE